MDGALAIFLLKFLVPSVGSAVAMVSDLRERRIPNWLSVGLLTLGLLFQLVTSRWHGLGQGLAGAAVGFSILFLLYAVGGGGAGDVKFMTAVGAWLGPYHTFIVFVMSAIVVGLFAVLLVAWRMLTRSAEKGTNSIDSAFRARIPYAVPITLCIIMRGLWMLLIHRTG